jgi:hypothetical protein
MWITYPICGKVFLAQAYQSVILLMRYLERNSNDLITETQKHGRLLMNNVFIG